MALTSRIHAYDPNWPMMFEMEKKRIVDRLGERVAEVHHVGSTAVPGLRAKPEIDILIVVKSLAAIDEVHAAMSELGYAVRGECGIPGRHYYSKDVDSVRTHKAHVCEPEHSTVHEQLAFRDYLRAHRAAAQDYERLKIRLARTNTDGMVEYLDGKRPFIEAILRKVMGEDGASSERCVDQEMMLVDSRQGPIAELGDLDANCMECHSVKRKRTTKR